MNLWRGSLFEYHPLAIAMAALSLFSLNILGKLGYVAIFAGECRDPARAIGRSIAISAPIIALMFILGTSSVLAFFHPVRAELAARASQH